MNNMVDSIDKNLLSVLTSLTTKITSKDLRNNLKKIERQLEFDKLSEIDKVKYALQFADADILDYQEVLESKRKLKNLPYLEWKGRMLDKFNKAMSKKEFLRCKQFKEEACYIYFERMSKEGSKIIEDGELVLEIALIGLQKFKEEIETVALEYKEISEDFLAKVKGLELIKKEAYTRRKIHTEQSKQVLYTQKTRRITVRLIVWNQQRILLNKI